MSVFKDDILAGKVAFVTGGGSGICKEITRQLMAHGAKAAIVGRTAARLEESAAELSQDTGQDCLAAPADVRQPEAVEGALDAAIARFGKVDLIVNGAAGNFLSPAAAMSYNAFRTVMDIDTNGTFNVCRAAFGRGLRDHGGSILNISATLHYAATPLQAHASAAKAAIDSLTKSLALEWGPSGVRVNAIAPGPIADTEGMSRLAPKGMKEQMEANIPLGRFGTCREIADAAVFLSSDAATYIHGAILVVDGGAWLPGMGMAFSAAGRQQSQ